jgi:hypothetical protein
VSRCHASCLNVWWGGKGRRRWLQPLLGHPGSPLLRRDGTRTSGVHLTRPQEREPDGTVGADFCLPSPVSGSTLQGAREKAESSNRLGSTAAMHRVTHSFDSTKIRSPEFFFVPSRPRISTPLRSICAWRGRTAKKSMNFAAMLLKKWAAKGEVIRAAKEDPRVTRQG